MEVAVKNMYLALNPLNTPYITKYNQTPANQHFYYKTIL